MCTHICISSPVCFLTEKQGGDRREREGGNVPACRNPKATRATSKRSSKGGRSTDLGPLLFLLFSFSDHNPGSVPCKKQSEAPARATAVLSVQRRQQQQQRRGREGGKEGGRGETSPTKPSSPAYFTASRLKNHTARGTLHPHRLQEPPRFLLLRLLLQGQGSSRSNPMHEESLLRTGPLGRFGSGCVLFQNRHRDPTQSPPGWLLCRWLGSPGLASEKRHPTSLSLFLCVCLPNAGNAQKTSV